MPVRKPRVPDARQQMAYEMWIEQKKALNPSYALECRERQARRAARQMVIGEVATSGGAVGVVGAHVPDAGPARQAEQQAPTVKVA